MICSCTKQFFSQCINLYAVTYGELPRIKVLRQTCEKMDLLFLIYTSTHKQLLNIQIMIHPKQQLRFQIKEKRNDHE